MNPFERWLLNSALLFIVYAIWKWVGPSVFGKDDHQKHDESE